MVTQAFAQEAETPTEQNLDTAIDATHGEPVPGATGSDPTVDTHSTAEVHADESHGVFPPFDPATFPSQLLWLAITFGALYLVMSRVALPRLGGILENRKALIDADLAAADADRMKTDAAIAAYEQAIEASHVFNLLQARGVISVQERASYMGRVRDLARGSCETYAAKMMPEWTAKYPEWSL